MRNLLLLGGLFISLLSCNKDNAQPLSDMEEYVYGKSEMNRDFLIACAAGSNTSFMGSTSSPISIFYYMEEGAENVNLFSTSKDVSDPENWRNYSIWSLPSEPLFQGQMGRFLSPPVLKEKWVIVTYEVNNKLHISDPIYLDPLNRPTEDINNKIQITETGTTPSFDWTSDFTEGNVIYFSLISDSTDQFISGTYTTDKTWTFYDLSNVTLNVTPTDHPTLNPSSDYRYIHMGVDEDNWVRSFGEKGFMTN